MQIVRAAITGGNHANIVTQHLNRQCMGGIANQQHAAGQFGNRHNLAHDAFIADDRLTFVYAVHAAFINHHLIAVRIVYGGDHLGDHFLFILAQRRAKQFTQACVFLLILPQHQQLAIFQQQFLA